MKGFVIGMPFDRHRVSSDVCFHFFNHPRVYVPSYIIYYCLSSTHNIISTFHQAAQVRAFINELCKTKMLEGLHYTFWNECYTSKVDPHNCYSETRSSFTIITPSFF